VDFDIIPVSLFIYAVIGFAIGATLIKPQKKKISKQKKETE